ncbi:MAG: dihydroorotate dehydrogenase-like protein [Rikenellaceae bacterium]|nr:dihydroorotate dehydrogenase-like protein [Rikenellaceae bacterium]
MIDLSVKYLGLELRNPIIVSSSPFTASADKIVRLEQHGAGAVVLKSIFEEQLIGETAFLDRYHDYPEAADYLGAYVRSDYVDSYLDMIAQAKQRTSLPIIASINCVTGGEWVEFARRIEEAGADAIELNIFLLPTDKDQDSDAIERQYLDIVGKITSTVSIPVSVKLGSRFTNILSIVKEIYYRHGKGVVLYNRFYEPDINIDNISLVEGDTFSMAGELRNSLRWIALTSAQVPLIDISVSTGVHTGEDAVKALLAGARTVQVCTALYKHGLGAIDDMLAFMTGWMQQHTFQYVSDFSGMLNQKGVADPDFYERVQYMRYFPKEPVM